MSHVLVIQHPNLAQLSLPHTQQQFDIAQHTNGNIARIPLTAVIGLPDAVRPELQAACARFWRAARLRVWRHQIDCERHGQHAHHD
ncbi:hypothetical protein [Kingella kingae]|uniref:hypothetical protein n=1 Tax=Kingella kingae TaxID=504 RepID=UPI0004020A68|nr:hypothetical protein [Kingella kingae]